MDISIDIDIDRLIDIYVCMYRKVDLSIDFLRIFDKEFLFNRCQKPLAKATVK